MTRTVLVTGGFGFIGHHLVKELIAEKYKVIILDNLSNSNEYFLREPKTKRYSNADISLHKQDVRNKKAVYDIFKLYSINSCIHLAAKISVQDSIIQPFETVDINVLGTLNVLQECSNNSIDNFVLASSAAVYGPPKRLPISEEHVTQPISPYGASKVASEALVSSFRSRLRNCKILRFFNVYGKGQTSTYAGVITKFAERLSNHLPPVIYGRGDQTRDFVDVSDIVRAIILAVESKQKASPSTDDYNTFNIGTGKPTSILDLANIMIDIFGFRGEIAPVYSHQVVGDIMHSYADTKRAKDILQFEAKEDLRSRLVKHLS